MELKIRKAEDKDCEGIMRLLRQVNDIHAAGRPDIFVKGLTKYDIAGLLDILHNPETPVFVAIGEENDLAGYCFCIIEDHSESINLTPIKTLYIDDLCVDENHRGHHVGQSLFEYVKKYAKDNGFYNVTLNVWECNPGAQRFYEAMGMKPMKTVMEIKL